MKKSKLIVLTLFVLLFTILAIACAGEKKTPASVDAFYEKAASCRCEKAEIAIEDEHISSLSTEIACALKEREGKLMVCEFYVAKNDVRAKKIYSILKAQSKDIQNGETEETKSGNYNKFVLSNESDTLIVSRVANTVLVIKANNMFTKCIEKILTGLEY